MTPTVPGLKTRPPSRTARPEGAKLNKQERELVSYLELHPGSHNLKQVEDVVPGASVAARALARKKMVALRVEPLAIAPHHIHVSYANMCARTPMLRHNCSMIYLCNPMEPKRRNNIY